MGIYKQDSGKGLDSHSRARSVELFVTTLLVEEQMVLTVELEQEEDGRWLAEVIELPGVLAYGPSAQEAITKAKALALRVVADRLENGEAGPELQDISFQAA
jgi:predicted RNase H-like HicB family nuclease